MRLFWKASATRLVRSPVRYTRPRLEELESRLVLYSTTGNAWPSPQLITLSFVPDGTLMTSGTNGNVYSDLFSTFNARWATNVWQAEILKAAQLWAQAANINFTVVSDNGTPSGGGNYQQGDPGMGDIRVGAYTLASGYLGVGYLPPPANDYSIAGDFDFNDTKTYNINGSAYDLQTVAMHELGHALGLGHSLTYGAVMYKSYHGTLRGLTGDDVSGVQAIYGARQDPYANGNFATATDLTASLDPTALTTQVTNANLSSSTDVNYWTLTAPSNTTNTLTVSVQSAGLSLLRPSVTVYAADQVTVLASASDTTSDNGSTLTLTINNVTPGQQFYVQVSGSDTTAFATGHYDLTVALGGNPLPSVSPPLKQIANGAVLTGGGGLALQAFTVDFYTVDDSVPHPHGPGCGCQICRGAIQSGPTIDPSLEVLQLTESQTHSPASLDPDPLAQSELTGWKNQDLFPGESTHQKDRFQDELMLALLAEGKAPANSPEPRDAMFTDVGHESQDLWSWYLAH
jgi:hypothetical protein